ncbi:MAG: FtsX-like permease family protein [Anaerolineaceae bacterium]|nr:FtsX-like permease family protein [Anaerolineaceae bacterium]
MILRLVQRSLAQRFLQSTLLLIGVALGVAMVIAIDLANSAASQAFALSARSVRGRATHSIAGGPGGLPTALYTQLRREAGLRNAAPVISRQVRVDGLGERALRLLGVDPFAEAPFRDYLAEGGSIDLRIFTRLASEPGLVLPSQPLAERFGVAPGDDLTLRSGDRIVTVRVAGLLQPTGRVSSQALDDLLLTDIATAQELLGMAGRITRIDLLLPPEQDLDALRALLPAGVTLSAAQEDDDSLSQMTEAFEISLESLSVMALVVGVFLIYNTVVFSVVQRRPLIATLRALGASRRQIFAFILGEALIAGALGTLAGIGLGLIFGRVTVALVTQTISDLYFSVNVQGLPVAPRTLLRGIAAGVLASLGAACLPALEATFTPPAGAMLRSGLEGRARRLLPLASGAALALALLALALLQMPGGNIRLAFIALTAFIVAGAALAPLALTLLLRALTPVTGRLFGVSGRMAPRAVLRSLSRSAVAVAALTVAVSVIVGVGMTIASYRNAVSNWLDVTLAADIYVSTTLFAGNRSQGDTRDVDPAIVAELQALPGVAQAVWVRAVAVDAPDYPQLPPVNLDVVSGDVTQGERRFAWLGVEDAWTALDEGQLLVSESFAFRRGIDPDNARLTLQTDRGPRSFPVAGVYYDYSSDQGTVLMEAVTYRAHYDDPWISSLGLILEDGASLADLLERLRGDILADKNLLARANSELRADVFVLFERTFMITGALQLLATLVAFIGILSALLALQLEHTRQYGVLRACGMSPVQLWRYTLLQTGLMGVTAGALSLPVGALVALVMVRVVNLRAFGWALTPTLQAEALATAFAVAVGAALLAGIYPAWRLGRLATALALRSE